MVVLVDVVEVDVDDVVEVDVVELVEVDEVDDVEGADDLVQEVGGLLLPGPDLLLDPEGHQGVPHHVLVAGLPCPDQHLGRLVLEAKHRFILPPGDERV